MNKYLKSFLIVLIFAFLIFIFIFFLKKDLKREDIETIYKKDETMDVVLKENEQFIYLYDKKTERTRGIIFEKSENKEELISDIINYITQGIDEFTGLDIEIKVEKYEIIDDLMIIKFNQKIFDIEKDKYVFFLEELSLSFKEIGIKRIFLETEKGRINVLGDFVIKNGIENNILSNVVYLNHDIKSYKMIRLAILKEKLEIYNYIVDEKIDSFTFINQKINDYFKNYQATLNNNVLSLDISYKLSDTLRNQIKISFEKTIFFNFENINDIIIK